MPSLGRGPNLYVDGISIRSLITKAKAQAQKSQQATSSKETTTTASQPKTQVTTSARLPRGKLYIDGEWDIATGPPATSGNTASKKQDASQKRTTALSLLVESGDAKEVSTPKNWLQLVKPNQRNTHRSYNVTVDPNTVTEGTFDAYHPSTTEKIKWWFDRNIDKIPVLNFFHLMHEQTERAKKETMVELAAKGETGWKAKAMGFLYGELVDPIVNLPGAAYDTLNSLWKSIPANDMGPTGIKHETNSEKIITGNPDEDIENELILARYAPRVYKSRTNLEKQIEKLNEQALVLSQKRKELEEQARWFEQYRKKAEQDPVFARLYNSEAALFNQQINEYNEQVNDLLSQYQQLSPDLARVNNFNKNLEKASKSFAIGELVGSLVSGTLLSKTAGDTLTLIAPEKTVESVKINPDILHGNPATRVTLKETVYKGWLRKRPIETKYVTGLVDNLVPPDEAISAVKTGNVGFMKSLMTDDSSAFLKIAGRDSREFTMTKVWSKTPFNNQGDVLAPNEFITPAKFEKITGKPWTIGAEKIDDLGISLKSGGEIVDVYFPGATPDTTSDALVAVRKSKFSPQKFTPEFTLQFEKSPGLSAEDWKLLTKITKAGAKKAGNKWLKVSKSGNVFQSFYDPPVETIQTEKLSYQFKPELGNYKVNTLPKGASSKFIPTPMIVGDVDLHITIPQLRQLSYLSLFKTVSPQSYADSERETETNTYWELDYDINKLKQKLKRQTRVGTSSQNQGDIPITIPDISPEYEEDQKTKPKPWVPIPPPNVPPVETQVEIPGVLPWQPPKPPKTKPKNEIPPFFPPGKLPRPRKPRVKPPAVPIPFAGGMFAGSGRYEGPWIGWGRKNDTPLFTLTPIKIPNPFAPKSRGKRRKGGRKRGIL
ncbi:hypothetical protein TPV1_gp21 [Thermococcus prieurii virus 1]|uniref:hypothetical protein n=1 Tax=Thermococcus prieurii virus 1 TaxID=1115696 RepID=UPI00024FB21B|nr:hypothetical protein TPV1_gp21 [Thermococcus prieurii virus 1]AEY69069.1 non-globular protein [Thermococcus prieurii virus 1]AFA44833.1 hypothetical protein [Thermococcus prieurii virus 1]